MTDLKALPTPVLLHIAKLLAVSLQSLVSTIALFDEGGTVPFIARYRKEATGNLDEVQILAIQEKLEQAGIHVARRTVAKYRIILKIPPSHQRRRS